MISESPLVSVIVPVYNTEHYIRKCIDSLVNQSYKNLNIIIVNDGTPDKAGEIAEEYSQIDKRVKVIHKKNGGASSARNVGLEMAKGEYICFIDSDDWLNSDAINNLVTKAIEEKSDVVMPDRFNKVLLNGKTREELLFPHYEEVQSVEDFVIDIIVAKGRAWRVSSVLYKTDIIKNNNVKFPVGYTAEDVIFNLEFLSNASKFSVLKEPTLNVNKRVNSVTASYRSDLPEIALFIDAKVENFISLNVVNRDKAVIAKDSLLRRNIIMFITLEMSNKNNKTYAERSKCIYSVLNMTRVNEAFKRKEYIQPYWNSKFKIYYAGFMDCLLRNNFKATSIFFSRICNSFI
ncbi:glycosyltransferase family 2 protein [Rossellomorea aquimaris]|uniref:Glycosyltransferase n=1 Tax=Rossellomorea aquimaris TaxID=189382 RepID=A0A5D4TRL0_9BACI|nr:glycosyltransferase family 2 protein [Rossellomorea aquimaris]TYS78553.1 glycosyltransferase [Rossellomorea aquimaris]